MEQLKEINITMNEAAVEKRYITHTGETQPSVDNVEDYIEEA